MAKLHKGRKKGLLSSTRTQFSQRVRGDSRSLSSRTTRNLIRSHHNLHKELKKAQIQGDNKKISRLTKQIEDNGGIEAYQQASIQGQSAERGGDTSKFLVEWIRQSRLLLATSREMAPLRLLEVGSLRPDNACARSGLFDMERIDLNSQHPEIKSQDFMLRPTPKGSMVDREDFDVISLSLVVNYVPDAEGRGEMLRRCSQFLRPREPSTTEGPYLFLVLPMPCVFNSRYLTDERLRSILHSLGYRLAKWKVSSKLAYYLFELQEQDSQPKALQKYPKEKLQDGKAMNNFSIVLK